MDWTVFWCAAGVVVALSSLIIGCFKSLSNDIRILEKDIVIIKTVMVMNGHYPKELNMGDK